MSQQTCPIVKKQIPCWGVNSHAGSKTRIAVSLFCSAWCCLSYNTRFGRLELCRRREPACCVIPSLCFWTGKEQRCSLAALWLGCGMIPFDTKSCFLPSASREGRDWCERVEWVNKLGSLFLYCMWCCPKAWFLAHAELTCYACYALTVCFTFDHSVFFSRCWCFSQI